jgi:PLP dependent protein
MSIADNLRRVQERIASAAESAGRRADEITLVGVTKYVDTNAALALVVAGCTNLGESRPQELWKKVDEFTAKRASGFIPAVLNAPTIHWHLIGHLQRNKVARTLPLVTLIHSVDSERLLTAINEAHAALNNSSTPINVLLEVNTSGDSAKTGLTPTDVELLVDAAPNYPHVVIRGLMTMAALDGGPQVAARNFAALREIRDRLKLSAPTCVQLYELSMGMSDDFEVAIREGATMVRVGSLLWRS